MTRPPYPEPQTNARPERMQDGGTCPQCGGNLAQWDGERQSWLICDGCGSEWTLAGEVSR